MDDRAWKLFKAVVSVGQSRGGELIDLWVKQMIPWRRVRLPAPGFWLGEFHGLYRQTMRSQRAGHD